MALSVETAERLLARELEALAQAKAQLARALDQYNQAVNSGTIRPGTQEALRLRGELGIASLQAEVETLETAVAEARQALAAAQAEQSRPTQSAGQTTANAQRANDDGADTQTPNPAPQVLTPDGRIRPSADTETVVAPGDTGTDDPVRTATTTQSTPPLTAAPGPATPGNADTTGEPPGQLPAPTPTQQAGAAASSDDQTNPTRSRINALFSGPARRIVPQSNILDKYASYTYSISMYIMSPAQYKKLLTSKKREISGFQLLMQSGGAPIAGGTMAAVDVQETQQAADGNSNAVSQPTLGRNQFFPLDYYIDEVRLKSVISGKGTNGAHNVFEMSFRLIEPNGITLLDNLYAATQQYVTLQGGTSPQNYAAQNYLMVIRFYGYDENGNLLTASGRVQNPDKSFGPEAVVEKFIPFQFTGIKFRIANKLTEYECSAVCPQNAIATGQARGTIPYNIELTSTTLRELLTGNQTFKPQGAVGDNTRGADGSGTSRTNANAAQANQRATQQYGLPPVGTNTEFEDALYGGDGAGGTLGSNAEIATATGQAPAPVVAGTAPTQNSAPPKATSAPKPILTQGLADALNRFQAERVKKGEITYPDEYEIVLVDQVLQDAKVQPPNEVDKRTIAMNKDASAAAQKDGKKQSADNTTKNIDAVAGVSIIQFIDQVVRTSTYIYDQQIALKGKDDKGRPIDIPQGQPADVLAWYRIGVEAEQKQYDPKRNDYAYKIKYQVTLYQVSGVKSPYFPDSQFQGTHKLYNYWFTGQNNSIINLEQDYNYLYYITVNGNQPKKDMGRTANYREYEKRLPQPQSNQSSQGQAGYQNEPSANAADYLYSPADQSRVRMTIVGDPAWLQQGEIWAGIQGFNVYQGPFLPDGTINYERQDVLFELAFNKPVDYDLQTGLLDPGIKNYGSNRQAGEAGTARQSYVYKAVDVTSVFSRGRFTQDLNGVLITFPLPSMSKNAGSTDADAQEGGFYGQTTSRAPTVATDQTTATVGAQSYEMPSDDELSGTYLTQEDTSTSGQEDVPNIEPSAAAEPPDSGGQIVGPEPSVESLTLAAADGLRDSSDVELTLVSTRRADRLAREAAGYVTTPNQVMDREA